MNIENGIFNLFSSRLKNVPFIFKSLTFIVLFSLLLSCLIYLREAPHKINVSYYEAYFWQLMIWSPWLLFVVLIKKVWHISLVYSTFKRGLLLGSCYLLILWLHWFWYLFYSRNYSPYLGFPEEKYGVFPYFFIFWSLLDVVILVAITVYLSAYFERRIESVEKSNNVFAIQVRRGTKKVLLKESNIYWISAEGYYINIHSDQGKFLLRRTLKSILEVLPKSNFIRIHRSAIINIHYLEGLSKTAKGLMVLMKDGNTHAVSRSNVKNLKAMLTVISI